VNGLKNLESLANKNFKEYHALVLMWRIFFNDNAVSS